MPVTLVPQSFDDLIGQKRVISMLKSECRTSGTLPSHMLLTGPPGLGKTTLATIFAKQANMTLVDIQCGPMSTPKAITRTLMDLSRDGYSRNGTAGPSAKRYLVFFDEISELSDTVFLHSVLSSCELNPDPYGGISWLPDLTVMAATNWPHMLSEPFKSRFPIKLRVDPYTVEDLEQMIARNSPKISKQVVADIARRSRGSARTAIDFGMLVERHGIQILDNQGITPDGLRPIDRSYLDALRKAGRPLSLSTVSAMIQEDSGVVRKEIEPYLLQIGKIEITPKGRLLVGSDAEAGSLGRRPTSTTEAFIAAV